MRIRRQLSEHDTLTALAAERDRWRAIAEARDSQSTSEPPMDSDAAPYLDDSHVYLNPIQARGRPTRSDLWGWWPVVKTVSLCLMTAALFVGVLFWVSSPGDAEAVDSTSRRLSKIENTQQNTIGMQQNTIKVQDDSIRKLKEAMVQLEEAMRIARKRIYDERYGNQQQTPAVAPTPKAATAVCDGPSLDCGNRLYQYQGQDQR